MNKHKVVNSLQRSAEYVLWCFTKFAVVMVLLLSGCLSSNEKFLRACSANDVEYVLANCDPAGEAARASTGLFVAAQEGNYAVVEALLAAGASPLKTDDQGYYALDHALAKDHMNVAELLINALLESQSSQGSNIAIVSAATWNKVSTVEFLLEKGVDPDSFSGKGWSALACVSWRGHSGVCKLLLEHGADPNFICKDSSGTRPLIIAAVAGHVDIVNLLLANGANELLADADGKTARMRALQLGKTNVLSVLKAE